MKGRIIVCLLVVALSSQFLSAGIVFDDDFTSFTGWTYHPSSSGSFAIDPASWVKVEDLGGGTKIRADKSLSATIPATWDFTFTVTMKTFDGDPSDHWGGGGLALLDPTGYVVAGINSWDASAGSGDGAVHLWAQGGEPSGPLIADGGGPTFDATFKIQRVGSTWSAWEGSTFLGSVVVTPDREISQVSLELGSSGSTEHMRDVRFDRVMLDAVPEPATAGLLAVGGFFSLIRRRKMAN